MPATITNQLITLLSYRGASVIITTLAIVSKILQKFIFYGLDDDKCYQIQAAKNFLSGHGISIYEVAAGNLSSASYAPLIKWPPAYSIMVSPFYSLSGNNHFWGSLWLDLIAAGLFVWIARKIILQLDVPVWLVNVYTLVLGFYIFDFIQSDSTDLLTLVIFLAAVLLTLKFLKSPGARKRAPYLIVALLLTCCLLRYMYIPVAASIPAYLFWRGYRIHDKQLLQYGTKMFLSLVAVLGIYLVIQKLLGGSSVYVYPTETGLYPKNLLRTAPFLFSGIANLGVPAVYAHELTGISYDSISSVINWIHLVVLAIVLAAGTHWVIKTKKSSASSIYHLAQLTMICTLAVIAVLFLLSLRYAPVRLFTGLDWTYVMEGRYYALSVFLVQLLLFVAWYKYRDNRRRRNLLSVLVVACALTALHGLLFTVKKTAEGNSNFFHKQELVVLDSSRMVLQQFIRENPGKHIVCASGDPMFNNFAALWEQVPGLYDYRKLNTPNELATAKETVIFVPVKQWYASQLTSFMANPNKKFVANVGDWTFYSLDVSPAPK